MFTLYSKHLLINLKPVTPKADVCHKCAVQTLKSLTAFTSKSIDTFHPFLHDSKEMFGFFAWNTCRICSQNSATVCKSHGMLELGQTDFANQSIGFENRTCLLIRAFIVCVFFVLQVVLTEMHMLLDCCMAFQSHLISPAEISLRLSSARRMNMTWRSSVRWNHAGIAESMKKQMHPVCEHLHSVFS